MKEAALQEPASVSPTPEEWFHDRATAYVEAQILFHLNQAGVFDRLDEGPAGAAELASSLGLDPAVLACLLEYVEAVDDLLALGDDGLYRITPFGRRVLDRYGRTDGGRPRYNLFDVRVGAYGPVWAALGDLARGSAVYGRDVRRAGGCAEAGLHKVVGRLLDGVDPLIAELGLSCVAVLGVGGGVPEQLAARHPGLALAGVDRDPRALDEVSARLPGMAPHLADVFDPGSWAPRLPAGAGALVSIYFHEFLARGEEELGRVLGELRRHLPGWYVIALEQERLPAAARAETPPALWKYAQANVLIHHLIGNGKVLRLDQWRSLLTGAGCAVQAVRPAGFLGYQTIVARL